MKSSREFARLEISAPRRQDQRCRLDRGWYVDQRMSEIVGRSTGMDRRPMLGRGDDRLRYRQAEKQHE